MFPLEKCVDFTRLGKLGILLVADTGADRLLSLLTLV